MITSPILKKKIVFKPYEPKLLNGYDCLLMSQVSGQQQYITNYKIQYRQHYGTINNKRVKKYKNVRNVCHYYNITTYWKSESQLSR